MKGTLNPINPKPIKVGYLGPKRDFEGFQKNPKPQRTYLFE